ncbi:Uncharacterised protein [Halioglobus japonicus]|nr:Uncharacterised protein [Halioglobus japonicus]
MSVIRTLIVAPVVTAMLALFSLTTNAADQAEMAAPAEASLVVYRAGESIRTQRLRIAVRVGGEQLGRLQSEEAISTSQPAGTYLISTGIPGAETLEIDLKPGMVHYVRIDPRERTQSLSVSVAEVEEQVAQVERPELNSAI